MKQVSSNLTIGFQPSLIPEGTSGAYFLQDCSGQRVAVFKPEDEEPFAPNNPRGFVSEAGSKGFREGILSGEAAKREVAAFRLDGQMEVGVPQTYLTDLNHQKFSKKAQKTGSL